MDPDSSQPGTPVGGPLQAITHNERASQRDSVGSVHDKISQFNNMSIAMQSKQLERKTADAALKRAMLGREEAEAELRTNKAEIKSLQKLIAEGKERERRVGERLEAVMVHSQALFVIWVLTLCRSNMAAQKRHTHTRKPYGRRKFDEQGKRPSRPSQTASSSRKTSKQPAVP